MSRSNRSLDPNTYEERLEKELQLMEEEGLWTSVDIKQMESYRVDVYKSDKNLKGTMYLYKKSLN